MENQELKDVGFKIENPPAIKEYKPKISRKFFYVSVIVFIIIIIPTINGLLLPKTTGFDPSLLVVYKAVFYELIFVLLVIISYEVYRKIIKNK